MMNGAADSKKEAALLSGYSMAVAENAKAKIEETEGFQNAMIGLATKSNNLLLAVMSEFNARGLKDFSNADLTKALNAISGAWDRIEAKRAPNRMTQPNVNPLVARFRERVETREVTITELPSESPATAPEESIRDADISPVDPAMDF